MLGTGWTEAVALAAAFLIAVLATRPASRGAVLLLPSQAGGSGDWAEFPAGRTRR